MDLSVGSKPTWSYDKLLEKNEWIDHEESRWNSWFLSKAYDYSFVFHVSWIIGTMRKIQRDILGVDLIVSLFVPFEKGRILKNRWALKWSYSLIWEREGGLLRRWPLWGANKWGAWGVWVDKSQRKKKKRKGKIFAFLSSHSLHARTILHTRTRGRKKITEREKKEKGKEKNINQIVKSVFWLINEWYSECSYLME